MPTTSAMPTPAMSATSAEFISRHLDIQEQGDITIVRFREPRVTDPVEIEELGRQLYQVLECRNTEKVVLDFGPVEFLPARRLAS